LYSNPAVETFAWIRGRRGLYDLANSGVAKLEVPAAAESPPLEDVVASLYDVSKNEVALTAGAQEGNFLAFAAVKPVVVIDNRKPRPLGRGCSSSKFLGEVGTWSV
jgi:hypothetical protein